ncbi:MAG: GAF domain-containing protein [Anaerolineae bacterium]|nr:GAF domain-containing protein [Anaerolineae bacterium]NUQ04540.1 GAF domain-containing protein [Anaerolineae bacterium]
MNDQTSRMSRRTSGGSAQEQLRQIMSDVDTLEEVFRSERVVLRRRAMSLPSGTLERLRQLHSRLDALSISLISRQIELRQLRALAETTALINSTLDTNSVLNQVMDTVVQLTGAERGYIMLTNKATGALEFRVARGVDREQLSRDEFIVSNTIINEVYSTAQPVLTDNARADPRYQSMESIVGYQLRSILAVPLIVRGEVIGVVYCDNRALTAVFKDSELNLLTAFANQAAVAIENARLFEAVRAQLAEITAMRDLVDSIFTSVISGLITLNGRDEITAFNHAAETITHLSAHQVIGMPLFTVLPYLRQPLAQRMAAVRAGETQVRLEFEVTPPEQGRRIWDASISPLSGSGGSVVLVLDDLTEQHERESQLTEARRYVPLALVENLRSEDLANLGGQTREITVMFADVRGFTQFSEQLEPEKLMEIINRYLSVASDSINLFEGMVDKYVGDAVTGLFNTQLNPQGDHALRAVRAALSTIMDVEALHEVLAGDEQLYFGIGVHTGTAVLGNVGSAERREFTAIGDAVEFAKLLQENAGKGDVLLSPETYEAVKDHFDCEALAPRKTKNRPDFTVMYRVVGMKR